MFVWAALAEWEGEGEECHGLPRKDINSLKKATPLKAHRASAASDSCSASTREARWKMHLVVLALVPQWLCEIGTGLSHLEST